MSRADLFNRILDSTKMLKRIKNASTYSSFLKSKKYKFLYKNDDFCLNPEIYIRQKSDKKDLSGQSGTCTIQEIRGLVMFRVSVGWQSQI